jgi:hypothetical protein
MCCKAHQHTRSIRPTQPTVEPRVDLFRRPGPMVSSMGGQPYCHVVGHIHGKHAARLMVSLPYEGR